eukprot:2481317-Lingulodinium_polyedra.AAC.1
MLEQDEWLAQRGRMTQEPYHACVDRSQVETSWTHSENQRDEVATRTPKRAHESTSLGATPNE